MLNNQPAKWDMEADFVSIGSGAGGLAGAIAAHDAGGSAIVLERTDKVGGVTALSMGEVWVPGNRYAAGLGVEDSPDKGFAYLRRLSMGHADERAILNFVLHAREALAWFEANTDLRMKAIRHCPDYFYGVDPNGMPKTACWKLSPSPPPPWVNGQRGRGFPRRCRSVSLMMTCTNSAAPLTSPSGTSPAWPSGWSAMSVALAPDLPPLSSRARLIAAFR